MAWHELQYPAGRGMVLQELDELTRMHMLHELDLDEAEQRLYISPRLTAEGRRVYPDLLRSAIAAGTPSSFAAALDRPGILMSYLIRRDGRSQAMPSDAADMLAEGELNRFYIRGVCRRAIDERVAVEVYRAKPVAEPRPDSQARIGARPDPAALLEDLRRSVGVNSALGIPNGVNSGLSVRFVRAGRSVR